MPKEQLVAPRMVSSHNTIALPTDIWVAQMMPLLGFRELLALCSSSQALQSALDHETVLRAALLRGGYPSKSVSDVMALVPNGQVHLPSPMRLLRIANGRQCESLESCHGTCRGSPDSFPRKKNVVDGRFGVFMCSDCVIFHTSDHPRNGKFTNDHVDRCGETCGPIAMNSDANGCNPERTMQLMRLFKEVKQEVERLHAAKRKREEEVSEANRIKRIWRVDAIVDKLSFRLKDCTWKDIALSRDEDGNFECGLVAAIMSPLVHAPTKASPASLAKIAKRIRSAFTLLYEERFHDLDFFYSEKAVQNRSILQTRRETENGGFLHYLEALEDQVLRENCDELSPHEILAHRNVDRELLNLVEDGRLVEALIHRLGGRDVFEEVVVNAIPKIPVHGYTQRRVLAKKLYRRFFMFDSERKTLREIYKDFEVLFKFSCARIETYLSLDWCDDASRRNSIRRDRDLMKRMRKVWLDQGENWDTDFDLMLTYLSANDGAGDFVSLLARHKDSLGRGKGGRKMPKLVSGQKDIRSFFTT